jgi:hypothetical protein
MADIKKLFFHDLCFLSNNFDPVERIARLLAPVECSGTCVQHNDPCLLKARQKALGATFPKFALLQIYLPNTSSVTFPRALP